MSPQPEPVLDLIQEALAGEPVALKQKDEHHWEIFFSTYTLGTLEELDMRIKPEGEKVLTMSPV